MNNSLPNANESQTVIVIPAYEPTTKLVDLVKGAARLGYQIIIVDDGSSTACDNIWPQISDYATLLRHQENQGKGAALKTAFRYLQNADQNFNCIVTMDADGQHLLSDLPHLVQAATANPNALILGSRTFDKDVPIKSKLGNKITRLVFSAISRSKISDTQTGFRAFSKKLLQFSISTSGEKYEYEMNVLLNCKKQQIPLIEVPIQTVYLDKTNSGSHFNGVKDSFLIYKNIFKFASSSFMSFVVDYLLFLFFLAVTPATAGFLVFCNVAARLISAAFNYTLNTRAVFKSKQPINKTLPQYICLAVGILIANSFILTFFTDVVGIAPILAKVITELTLFVLSFAVQSLFIFRKPRQNRLKPANAAVKNAFLGKILLKIFSILN